MQNIEMRNMRQKYAEMSRDRIFSYFWHHTFRPNHSNGNWKNTCTNCALYATVLWHCSYASI